MNQCFNDYEAYDLDSRLHDHKTAPKGRKEITAFLNKRATTELLRARYGQKPRTTFLSRIMSVFGVCHGRS